MMTDLTLNRRALLGSAGLGLVALALPGSGAAQARFAVIRTPEQWRRQLGPERYRILREAGTERAGTSPLNNEHRRGRFLCAGCSQALFASTTKFDSGTGWPSFFRALPGGTVTRGSRNMFFGPKSSAPAAAAPRPRVQRRAQADGPALLHERAGAAVPARVTRAIPSC